MFKNYEILYANLKDCLVSDRPLAVSLSGGIDSTGIASIIRKKIKKNINTFTIFSNDKNYDEFEQVKKTVKNSNSNINGYILTKMIF